MCSSVLYTQLTLKGNYFSVKHLIFLRDITHCPKTKKTKAKNKKQKTKQHLIIP
jgi:hypothetical protein